MNVTCTPDTNFANKYTQTNVRQTIPSRKDSFGVIFHEWTEDTCIPCEMY